MMEEVLVPEHLLGGQCRDPLRQTGHSPLVPRGSPAHRGLPRFEMVRPLRGPGPGPGSATGGVATSGGRGPNQSRGGEAIGSAGPGRGTEEGGGAEERRRGGGQEGG